VQLETRIAQRIRRLGLSADHICSRPTDPAHAHAQAHAHVLVDDACAGQNSHTKHCTRKEHGLQHVVCGGGK